MPTESTPDRLLNLTRLFEAPRPLLFAMWTRQEHLRHWSAPRGFTITEAAGDLRPGGGWRCTMVSPENEELRVGGTYREIIPDELVSFTHTWEEDDGPGHETLVTVRLAEEAGQTRLNFHQGAFKSTESRDGHAGGWSQCFDRLAEYLGELRRAGEGSPAAT